MLPRTKALWFNIQAEGRGSPTPTPRQAIMYTQYPFSEQKQQEAKVKVKETDPTWSQIWLFPVTHPRSVWGGPEESPWVRAGEPRGDRPSCVGAILVLGAAVDERRLGLVQLREAPGNTA